ncbi:hypothetical protein [Brevibacterium sediminis]
MYENEGAGSDGESKYQPPAWMIRYRNFKTLCSYVCGEFIRFYLTTGCDQIRYTHSQITEGLPNYSCRLDSDDGSVLLLPLDDWVDRLDEVMPLVRTWLGEHSDLKGCKPEKSHYQGDRYWFTRWQEANPW